MAVLSVCAYLLPSNEIAKFYALTMSLVGLVPLGSEYLFDYFYQETVGTNPGLFYLLGAGIYGGGLAILV